MAKGLALKSVSLFVRLIQFGCAAVILGIFSYFLATLSRNDLPINNHLKATEGISGIAVIYTVVGFLFVCCLGSITFFGLISILLDVCLAGAFGYIAWVNRAGASSCRGVVNTPYGRGNTANGNRVIIINSNNIARVPSFGTACRLQTACFAVAIIGAVFFLLSIPLSLLLIKHHKKEKAFGPGPKNGYTAGSGRRKFWQRKPKRAADPEYGMAGGKTIHNDTLPAHAAPDMRTSYATDTTAVGDTHAYGGNRAYDHNRHTGNGLGVPVGSAVPVTAAQRQSAAGGTF